jgi:hypothetical protein
VEISKTNSGLKQKYMCPRVGAHQPEKRPESQVFFVVCAKSRA